jgi:hypothetical protein
MRVEEVVPEDGQYVHERERAFSKLDILAESNVRNAT